MPLGLVWLWLQLNQSDPALFSFKNVGLLPFLWCLLSQAALFLFLMLIISDNNSDLNL